MPKDSVPLGMGCEMCLLPVAVGFGAVLLTMPASIAFVDHLGKREGADTAPPLSDNHVSAYFTVGGSPENKEGWTHSVNVEVFEQGLYGELRVEHYYLPVHYEFRTLRVSYLSRRRESGNALHGGITLGYRSASDNRVFHGFEIGLPLVVGTPQALLRFEPTYLISPLASSTRVSWSYRVQIEAYIPNGPLFWGFNVEKRAIGDGGLTAGALSLLFGVRF